MQTVLCTEGVGAPAAGTRAVGLAARPGTSQSRVGSARRRNDPFGAASITVALLVYVYAISQAPQAGWAATSTVAMLSVGAALLAAFVFLGTLYMQQVLGFSALATGAAWMTASVTSLAFVCLSQKIAASQFHTLIHRGYATAAALTGGFQLALWVCGLTGLAAVPVAFGLIRRTERPMTH
jgi:hypothetical protein